MQGVSEACLGHPSVRRWAIELREREPVCVGLEKPIFSNNIGEGVTSHQCVLAGGGGRAGRLG
jgi:hypothetical protein